jgi:predicted Zn-dependent protease
LRHFAIATRDELWLHGRLMERRLSHGEAFEEDRAIHARDTRDESLIAACDAAMDELRACVVNEARVRLVAEATNEGVTMTIVVTIAQLSVVTTPEHFEDDVALLRSADAMRALDGEVPARDVPLLWMNGSAAVLLHEAIGHPLEHGQESLALPPWLNVDVPLQPRRASFKDVPLLRMTNVVARQSDAPFALPLQRIEIALVDGGAYDPLTEIVTLRIAAARLIDGDRVRALPPFTIEESRANIASALIGASGEPLRYPGVICSREGQELVVGSFAPLVLTELR